ncbi:peptidase inhibitor family I36 protein [Saccharothrix hoggarensis]|uniref:Peptidase inhibitor family I36 protein n=1 Tax=Saccharothrix hoggarensis TaxID=913853 RepID=A0ABW3QE25_9PSEU
MGIIGKRLVGAALAIAGSVALVMSSTGVATAATPRNGVCEVGEFCLYYGASKGGSLSDFNGSIPNYGDSLPTCYVFTGAGTGRGECVKNNAGSAWNRTTAHTVTVYYNSGYLGASQTFGAGQTANFNSTMWDNNASHRFIAH